MFKKNDTPIAIYQDDYKPAKLMYNGMKVAGYSENEFRDSHIGVRHTYNDNLNCVLEGRHTQDTKYLIKWNQLVPDEEAVESVSDGIIQQGTNVRTIKINCKKNHIYFWHVQSKASENYPTKTQFRWYVHDSTNKTTLSGGLFYKRGEYETVTIRFQTKSDCLVHLQCARNEYPVAEQEINPITLSTKNAYLLDLTEMFGAGLEPDLETCRKIFPCEYYPYNAGEMMPMPKGAMVNFNQLKDGNRLYRNYAAASSESYLVENGYNYVKVTCIDSDAWGAANSYHSSPVPGHEYLFINNARGNFITRIRSGIGQSGLVNSSNHNIIQVTEDWQLCYSFVKAISSDTNMYCQILRTDDAKSNNILNGELEAKNMMLFDLTKMFGPGNEPSTVEEFRTLFPEDYYEYVESKSVPTIGFYRDGKLVENGLMSKYKENNYCANPCDVVPVTNPKLEIKRKLYWNQLADKILVLANYGSTVTSNNDIWIWNITAPNLAGYNAYIRASSMLGTMLDGHVYYMSFNAKSTNDTLLYVKCNNSVDNVKPFAFITANIKSNESTAIKGIFTYKQLLYGGWVYFSNDAITTIEFSKFNVIDLTKMFGAGNEPTLEEFKSMFPEDYYPYDEGHYISEYPVSSVSYEFPYGDLYGDGEVNDTVEPRVMVDGEWKCRVTRRWRKFYLKDAASLQMYTYRATPEGLLEQVETRYNVTRGVCVSIFIKVSGTVGFDLLKGVSGTKVYSNIFNAYPNIYTILPLEGSKHGHIAIHPNDAQYPWHFYASLSYNELGIPNDVDISDWTELRTYFNAWVERYITNASEENAPYILYQVQNPVVELYDPVPQMKTYPVNTFIDSEAIINTKIKTVDLK